MDERFEIVAPVDGQKILNLLETPWGTYAQHFCETGLEIYLDLPFDIDMSIYIIGRSSTPATGVAKGRQNNCQAVIIVCPNYAGACRAHFQVTYMRSSTSKMRAKAQGSTSWILGWQVVRGTVNLGDRQLLGVHIIFRMSERFVGTVNRVLVLILRVDLSPMLSPRSFVFTLFTAERHPPSLNLCLFLSAT